MKRVVFTDPAWALGADGTPEPGAPDLERRTLGEGVRAELGVFDDQAWVVAGPRLHSRVDGAHALVIYRCQVDEALLDAAGPQLQVVVRSGVGVDNLNRPLLESRGLHGYNIPDYCGDEVSTHTVALLLALERQVCLQDALVKSGNWGIHKGGSPRRTATLTAGIVGFGRIGKATSRKLQAFYGRVAAYDPHVPDDVMASHGVQAVPSLEDLAGIADALVLHADLNDSSRNMLGPDSVPRLRAGCLLVNTARGGLVDLDAVLRGLESGPLAGYASDVFTPEDPNATPTGVALLQRPDVVVSSHRAFLSQESEASLRRRVATGLRALLVDGRDPGGFQF